MNNGIRWAVIAGALLLAIGVGSVAYNAGVMHGIEQSGKIVVAPGAPYPYFHGWHQPWGFGFPFGPLFVIAFWFLVLRALFGGHRHWRRCGAHGRNWDEPRNGAPSQQ